MLALFPIMVHKIPKTISRQSVPRSMIQNCPSGLSIFDLAMQKNVSLIMSRRSRKRFVGMNSGPFRMYRTRARCTAALKCSSYLERERSMHRNGNTMWNSSFPRIQSASQAFKNLGQDEPDCHGNVQTSLSMSNANLMSWLSLGLKMEFIWSIDNELA
jgi:hypothetical protein